MPAEMSVVIVTPDVYETIAKTMRHVRAQSARGRLEIVIVAPTAASLVLDPADTTDTFAAVRVVEAGPIRSLAHGNAVGIRAATAPIVALLEDHSYPDPKWAEFTLERHREPWAAIAPVIGNPNPRSAISWADHLVAFSTWSAPRPSGPIDHLPTHNGSYKREVLSGYDSAELERLLQAEIVLHWSLQAKGHRFYLESRARVFHMNFERLPSFLQVQFHAGRVFAAVRSHAWPLWRRVVYACGSPLIPLVRLRWVLDQLRAREKRALPRGVLPALLAGLAASAAGELAGYALGPGAAVAKLGYFEFHRPRHARNARAARASTP
jgi:hypothetical protein